MEPKKIGITADELFVRYRSMKAPMRDFVYIIDVVETAPAPRQYSAKAQQPIARPVPRPIIIAS